MLDYSFRKDYYEIDPEKKDSAWADRLIRQFRTYMKPLVDPKRARINKLYLYGEQPMEKHKKKFRKPEELPFEFKPMAVFEKYRTILIAEREKAGVYIQLNSLDPSAKKDKEKDRKLMENRSAIEAVMGYTDKSIGRPPFNLMKAKQPDGEKIFNGNANKFDELGLNANKPEDISHFFTNFYQLDAEIEGEAVVNYFARADNMQQYLKMWFDDILAVKAIAGRVYADDNTCTPKFEYYEPQQVKWLKGKLLNGKDAKAIMVEENMTVHDFLSKVGKELTPFDVKFILESVNYSNNTTYDGIRMGNETQTCWGRGTNAIDYDNLLTQKIGVGYIEWKSTDVKAYKEGINALGNFKRFVVPPTFKPSERSNYKKESIYQQKTYTAYFVQTSSNSHHIVKFAPLFDMVTEGAEDEYSNYSFQIAVEKGQSSVEMAMSHIDIIHDAWFRFQWLLNRVKPRGTRYNYDVIVQIAKRMYQQYSDEANQITEMIKYFQESLDDFYVSDPNQKGGGQNPHFEKPNSWDDAITKFSTEIAEQMAMIGDKLGINAAREAYSPNPNDGYKLQMQMLAQSRNATEYMSRMVMEVLMNYAKHNLSIVQDMIKFEGSRAYKYLTQALGNDAVLTIKALNKVPFHKFGIFVESFNTDLQRQEIKQQAWQAVVNKEIPYHVYLLVISIDNYKKAAQILSYEKVKADQQKQAEQKAIQDAQLQLEQTKHANRMEEIQAKGQIDLAIVQETNKGLLAVAQSSNATKEHIKEMGLQAKPGENASRSDSKIREKEAEAAIKRGEPVDTIAV